MTTYRELIGRGISTRSAAALAGVARAPATRKPATTAARAARATPANKRGVLERARILTVVNSPRFVDLPPVQIYAQLLDEGVYLASISTIYRVLAENSQVRERRRLARHPARAILRTGRHRPWTGLLLGHYKTARPYQGQIFRLLRDD